MTFVPSRREHARFVCRLEVKISGSGLKTPVDGTMLNVGMGGAYIVARSLLRLSTVTLRVALGEETFAIDARVVRSGGLDPENRQATLYGIEFARGGSSQGRLRLLIDRVRMSAQAGPSARAGDPW